MKPLSHAYVFLMILVLFWCAGIFAAPMLKQTGWNDSAGILYSFFSRVCHQDEARSFLVAGEKAGVCIRCSAIYFAFFIGLIFLLFIRKPKTHIHARTLILIVSLPLFLDVVLSITGIHSSTSVARVLTGALFGFGMPWIIVPLFLEACEQIRTRKKEKKSFQGALSYVRKTK